MSTLGDGGTIELRISEELSERIKGLGLDGRLPDRIRFSVRSLISRPAPGAAVTLVFVDALGGGVGLLLRNSGWMCSSLIEGALECEPERESGGIGPEWEPDLEKFRCS